MSALLTCRDLDDWTSSVQDGRVSRSVRIVHLGLIVLLGWLTVAIWSRYWWICSTQVDRDESDQWP